VGGFGGGLEWTVVVVVVVVGGFNMSFDDR
jgi:hypothetical protein